MRHFDPQEARKLFGGLYARTHPLSGTAVGPRGVAVEANNVFRTIAKFYEDQILELEVQLKTIKEGAKQ